MMLKDYSAPVRQLLYTATDPMASLHRSLAYTLKTVELFIQTCWQCEAATHAGLNIVLHRRLLLWTTECLTPILQVFILFPNITSLPGMVLKADVTSALHVLMN